MVHWWLDWRRFKSLPFGGSDVLSQPQFVVDVLRTCEDTLAEIAQNQKVRGESETEKIIEGLKRKRRG